MHLDGENVTLDRLDLAGVRNDRVEVNAAGSPEPFANGSALDAPTTRGRSRTSASSTTSTPTRSTR